MTMNSPNLEMLGRIAEGLNQAWLPGICEKRPDVSKFSVVPLRGQGATSTRFQLRFAPDVTGKTLFIKKYTDKTNVGLSQLERDYRVGQWLAAQLGSQKTLRIDAPVLMLPDERILITPYVAGENLSPLFFKKLRWHHLSQKDLSELQKLVGDIGKGLVELQALPVETAGELFGKPSPEAIYIKIREDLEKFKQFYSSRHNLKSLVQKIIKIMDECLEEYLLRTPTFCFQHCDYILQNFIRDENGQLHLFDFANSRIGIPYFDTAHLINSLEDLTYLRTVSRSIVDKLILTFLQPFFDQSDFRPKLLSVAKAFFQLLSGTILLPEAGKKRSHVWRNIAMVDPEERIVEKLQMLLEEIEANRGM